MRENERKAERCWGEGMTDMKINVSKNSNRAGERPVREEDSINVHLW